jgi:hypothetical protein
MRVIENNAHKASGGQQRNGPSWEAVGSLSWAHSHRGQKVTCQGCYKRDRMTSKILSKSEQLQFSTDRHRVWAVGEAG